MPENGALPSVLLAVRGDAVQRTVCESLHGCGVENIWVVRSPEEAVGNLRTNPRKWEVFILDGSFPDAFEHVMEVRCRLNSTIQILVILPKPARREMVEAMWVGVDDFLDMPFEPHVLAGRLDAAFRRRKRSCAPLPFSVPPN